MIKASDFIRAEALLDRFKQLKLFRNADFTGVTLNYGAYTFPVMTAPGISVLNLAIDAEMHAVCIELRELGVDPTQ
jgi:hypothetical protein